MKNKAKKTISCSVDEEMFNSLNRLSKETGAKKSELLRRAIKKFENGGVDDSLFMLNVVKLVQIVGDMQEEIKPEHMEELKSLTENLMKIKGGK
ncbi:MAG: ribbon-helix-helix domain-containing protein [Lachnospiraceae bacterium]|nr:ribbon-helix-helix domain-containing protein [Lachnospiraceae bacterium]